jgi:hypothetical protein
MNRLRQIFCLLCLCALSVAAYAYPPFYSARETHGQVVDDETGQPLAGVVVVLQWTLRMQKVLGAPGWDDYTGEAGDVLKTVETVTDSDGRYVISAWGPLPRPPLRYVGGKDPVTVAFKGSYAIFSILEERDVSAEASDRTSNSDGVLIRLRRPKESLERQAMALGETYINLVPLLAINQWPDCPRLLAAMQVESLRLESLGVDRKFSSLLPRIERFDEPHRAILKNFQP